MSNAIDAGIARIEAEDWRGIVAKREAAFVKQMARHYDRDALIKSVCWSLDWAWELKPADIKRNRLIDRMFAAIHEDHLMQRKMRCYRYQTELRRKVRAIYLAERLSRFRDRAQARTFADAIPAVVSARAA
jgi:hypothetical protein